MRHQVAVRGLGPDDQGHDLFRLLLQRRIGVRAEAVGDSFQGLVHVRIGPHVAAIFLVGLPRQHGKPAERSAPLQLAKHVGNRRAAIGFLPGGPQGVCELHVEERGRTDAAVAAGGGRSDAARQAINATVPMIRRRRRFMPVPLMYGWRTSSRNRRRTESHGSKRHVSRRQSAVDHQHGACHEGRLVGRQEQCDAGDLRGRAIRPRGQSLPRVSHTPGFARFSGSQISVSVVPGQTTLKRILYLPYSTAKERVRLTMAPLAAVYMCSGPSPINALAEDMLTTLPDACSIIDGSTACVQFHAPFNATSTFSQELL